MFESKYSKFLTILLVIIIIAIIGLGCYLGYTFYKNQKTTDDANNYVAAFIEESDGDSSNQNTKDGDSEQQEISSIADAAESASTSKAGTKKRTYKGFNVIGTIEIPKTNVNYPVLEDPPTVKKLEQAVAAVFPRYAELNTVGNVVIVGHNYRNGLFFSNNKKLANGDNIYITDLEENKEMYTIYNVFQTSVDDTSFYNRDTDGKKEITLSTCADAANDQRIIIFARVD